GQPIWQQLDGSGSDKSWTSDDIQLPRQAYQTALAVPGHPRHDELLAQLRRQRLDPLLPHLEGIQHLLVVPTGEMAKIPIEALTDRFTISYIPSASIYAHLRRQHRALEGRSLLALGNPVFAPPEHRQRVPPEHGVLLSAVQERTSFQCPMLPS